MRSTVWLWCSLSLLAAGCAGGGIGDPCSSEASCADELGCSGPDDDPVCGIPPQRGCATASDCFDDGQTCHNVSDPCSPDGWGTACRPACTDDSQCFGLVCEAGACRPPSCETAGCPAHQVCDPLARQTGASAHGCVNVQCASASECASGLFCVNGRCQRSEGTCVEVVAVP